MNEIKVGNIGTIIIKDMSRLGRDYLVVGQIQEMLRQKGVRLISINDNHDSSKGDDDFLLFWNILNGMQRIPARKSSLYFRQKDELENTLFYTLWLSERRK